MKDKLGRIRRFIGWLSYLEYRAPTMQIPRTGEYKSPKVITGAMLAKLNASAPPARALREVEFQVFSQFGDDGIIQYLTQGLGIQERTFVEIGVEDYTESQTRFLLVKDKWSGLVVDGSDKNVAYIHDDPISMLFDVKARQAFVTAENVNDIITEGGVSGRIGLLSIDIDGMDYWVWNAVSVVDPAIVVIEYASLFGAERSIVVPYDPKFHRYYPDPSRLFYGASLGAMRHLAEAKGYVFIGTNSNGNNAYFVRREYAETPLIQALEPSYTLATFSEYGEPAHRYRGEEAVGLIRGKTVINVLTGQEEPL
ncbi:MAG TPA: hypothetical protein VHW60_22330 [Caulobacteraceae bacterium]|jgi:hypothetical protein|nr:hypothetical protein [Caulobacteraceae bacterium]